MLTRTISGLAWHTDDVALRTKFEEFGVVEEAVRHMRTQTSLGDTDTDAIYSGRRQGP